MKAKIISAVLLTICFGWLALLSGAIPVMAGSSASGEVSAPESAAAGEALQDTVRESEPDAVTDETEEAGGGETAATGTEEPESSSEESAPEPEAPPSEEESEPVPAVAALTITGDLMDNDTYYEEDPESLLSRGVSLRLPAEGYQILIIHTHTTEAYTPTEGDEYESSEADDLRTTDPEHNVVLVGEELARTLSDCGLNVLHDTGIYDYPSYNGSYARSGTAIEEYLAAYPGIRIVIDLHRDSIGEGDTVYKTSADIDGVECAQVMLVMGTDENLEHPGWRDNLAAALAIQTAVARRYPFLMRPLSLCSYRYNQQLTPGSMLLEVGTSGNTLDEALEAVRRFGEIAGPVMASWIDEE